MDMVERAQKMRAIEEMVLGGSLVKARHLGNAYRNASRMQSWQREKYMDTIYLLRTYFLETDYRSMSVEEFSVFWKKCRHYVAAAFVWDYGMAFFRTWVLSAGLPVWVRANIVNVMLRMSSALPQSLRESLYPKEDDQQLLGELSELNPSGAMIMIDLWGKPVSAGLIIGLINLARTDILSLLFERNPNLIPSVVKVEDVVLYLFHSVIEVLSLSKAAEFIESRHSGVIREMIGDVCQTLCDNGHRKAP